MKVNGWAVVASFPDTPGKHSKVVGHLMWDWHESDDDDGDRIYRWESLDGSVRGHAVNTWRPFSKYLSNEYPDAKVIADPRP